MTETLPAVWAVGDPYIVDAHQHFQNISQHYYPWLCDDDAPPKLEGDLTPIRRDYLPADYAADIAGFPVLKTVHIQNGWDPADPLGETRWLQSMAQAGGLPTAVVAFADLADPDVERLLESHAACPAARGIRQILNWHADPVFRVAARPDLMHDSRWRSGFSLLRRYSLSFDLQIYWQQMDMALELAKDHPDTILILEHFGMPVDRSAQGIADWAAAMRRLAAAPNVFAKLSGFGLGHPRWTLEDTVPLLKRTIDIFGPDRVMVGTNLPVDSLFADGRKIMEAIFAAVAGLSEPAAAKVRAGTAERVYRV